MSASLQLSQITLRVPDLARSLAFYRDRVGFVVLAQSVGSADLGVSAEAKPILRLIEDRTASPASRSTAGLFHAALLFPERSGLGSWLHWSAEQGVEFDGFSDHGVSEAIYFSDPDGNGLEFYTDRPRDQWPISNGQIAMGTQPLNIPSLLATAQPTNANPLGNAVWGHLHLRVTDLDRSEQFYLTRLGMAVTQRSYPGARFMAADGYHHHLGLNVWGPPNAPQPSNALGLASATFRHRGTLTATDLNDPDNIAIRLEPR